MNALWWLTVVVNLVLGIGAGLSIVMYFFWRKWFIERLRQVEDDVYWLYVRHGEIPPSLQRIRQELFKDELPDLPGPPDD